MQYFSVMLKGAALVVVAFAVVVIAAASCTSDPVDNARDYFADWGITLSELNVACSYFWAYDWHYYDALDIAEEVADNALPDRVPYRIALVVSHFENVIFDFVLPSGYTDRRIAEIEDASAKTFRAWGDAEWAVYKDDIVAHSRTFLEDFCRRPGG